MTATYPDEAVVSATAFSTVGTKQYTTTGATTEFALPSTIEYAGEVIATMDGIIQSTTSYYTSNSGGSITFVDAPNASNLYLKTISLPSRFRIDREYPGIFTVNYSNTALTTVDSNSYLLNGVATTFSIPTGGLARVSASNSMIVAISGIIQTDDSYTFPSATLGSNGIDLSTAPAIDELGTDYANTTLEIRAIIPNARDVGRFVSMADRKPDRGFSEEYNIPSTKLDWQSGHETVRLRSRRPKRAFSLKYTNVTGIEREAILNFYKARNGEYEAFIFDLAHLNLTGTMKVRFESSPRITHVLSSGSDLVNNFYSIDLTIKEVYA